MNEIYKDKLKKLRQLIPVGLRQGLTLLEKTDGDLEKAVKEFQEELVTLIISKTDVTIEIATIHLIKNGFDVGLTIKSIDEERYTLTELFLRKTKNKKEDALNKIMYSIEEKYNLERDFWLIFDSLKDLPSEIYCFLTVMEWLDYECWEDYGTALNFNLEIITEQLESKLALADMANSLRKAKGIQNFITARNELEKNKEYRKCKDYFITQRPMIIDGLYELVKNNIGKFP